MVKILCSLKKEHLSDFYAVLKFSCLIQGITLAPSIATLCRKWQKDRLDDREFTGKSPAEQILAIFKGTGVGLEKFSRDHAAFDQRQCRRKIERRLCKRGLQCDLIDRRG